LTLLELKNLALKLINSYSADGTTLPVADNADFNLSIVDFINVAYYKAIDYDKIPSVYSFTQNPIPNLLSMYTAFNITQHLDADLTYEAIGAKAYYFEVDGQGTVYVEEEIAGVWTTLSTITVPSTAISFTAYSGLITASDVTNSIRLRFSGTYPYNTKNRALYGYTFPLAANVPQFKPYMKYALPADYISLKKIVRNADDRLHESVSSYWIEGSYFVVDYFDRGSFDIHYYKRPDPLVADADIPEIRAEHHRYLAYHAAGEWLMANGRQTDGIVRLNQFDAFLNELKPPTGETSNSIQNAMGW
jgi:hypothetical protein